MKKYLFLLFICSSQIGLSQDIHFSQPHAVPTALNPAENGSFQGDQRAALIYRNQWRNLGKMYSTYGLAFDAAVNRKRWKNSHLGLGITTFNDKAGDVALGTTTIQGAIAYHTKTSDFGYLSAGIQSGIYQKSINQDAMMWSNQFEGTEFNSSLPHNENIATAFTSLDLSAGISYTYAKKTNNVISNNGYSSGKFKIGAAIHHLAGRKNSFYENTQEKLNWRYVLHGSTSIPLAGSNMTLQPSGVFQKQGEQYNILFGSTVKYVLTEQSKITNLINGVAVDFGAYYRWSDALILNAMIEFGSYTIGASYDITTSSLNRANNGLAGPEIFIRYTNPNPFGGGSSFKRRYKLKKSN